MVDSLSIAPEKRSRGGFALSGGDVHVWTFNTAVEGRAWNHLLSCDEAETARRLTDRNQLRFRNGRGALRLILGSYLLEDPASLEFSRSPHGKPCLASRELGFSISHSKDVVAIAVALSCEIGIDIEELRKIDNLRSIADHFFEAEEIDAISRTAPAMIDRVFLGIWTRKEAVLKAAGIGIADGLPVAVPVQDALKGIGVNLERPEGRRRFYLYDLPVEPRFVGALAACNPVTSIVERTLEREDI